MNYAQDFVATYQEVLEYFPEYADRELVPFFSALTISKASGLLPGPTSEDVPDFQ